MVISIRQSSKILDVTYRVPLTDTEYQALVQTGHERLGDMQKAAHGFEDVLRELHDRQGWKNAGYASFDAFVEGEFHFSRPRAYQLIAYAKVKQNVLPSGNEVSTRVDTPTEKQARELNKLPAAAQREVWEETVKASNGKPTAKAVAAQVNVYNGMTHAAPKQKSAGQPKRRDDVRTRCKALLDTCSERLAQEVYDLLQERLGVSS